VHIKGFALKLIEATILLSGIFIAIMGYKNFFVVLLGSIVCFLGIFSTTINEISLDSIIDKIFGRKKSNGG
jgi:hypothetical protein